MANTAQPPTAEEVASYVQGFTKKVNDLESFFNDDDAFFYFKKLAIVVAYYPKEELYAELFDKGLEKSLADLFMHLFEKRADLDFGEQPALWGSSRPEKLGQNYAFTLRYLLYMANVLVLNSVTFSINFCKQNGLAAHITFLSDTEFTSKHNETLITMFANPISLIEYFTMNVSSFSKHCDENKQIWTELNSVQVLLDIVKAKESTKYDSYVAIANLASDKQLEEITEIHSIIGNLIESLKAIQDCFSKDKIVRADRQVVENNQKLKCKVAITYQENKTTISILVILQGLYKLAINEKVRNQIYFEYHFKDIVKPILAKGNKTTNSYIDRNLRKKLTFHIF
jgi:hypothetical protein